MSILTYNGVVLGPQWLTLEFSNDPWYDETQTDILGTRITIAGQCLLSTPIPPISGNPPANVAADNELAGDDDAATALVVLRNIQQLSEPRKQLSFQVNGTEMIPSSTPSQSVPNFTIDARNGPIPGPLRVVQVTEGCFICQWSVVSHWTEGKPLDDSGLVLSSRWTDNVTIDQDMLSRRERQGKVVVSSATFTSGLQSIDRLRKQLIVTSVQPGFIREYQRYTLHPNGLEMGFNIVDREQWRMCPEGTTFADGAMVTDTQTIGSPGRNLIVSVTLRGPKKQESNPAALVRTATAIAFQKANLNGGFFPTRATFSERLWKHEVTVTLTGMAVPPKGAGQEFLGLEANLQGFGQTVPGQVGQKSPDPGTRGTANIFLHACPYLDPTQVATLNRADNSVFQGGNGIGESGKIPGG